MSRNALIVHGGGLVDPSKHVLLRIGKNLYESHLFDKVFIGRYSFESFYTPEFMLEYHHLHDEKRLEHSRGTYFGTCRGINLTNETLLNKALSCLKEKAIDTIIVAGGDGSSRQVAEIHDAFSKEGIIIIFAIPLTIDGINGGESIGLKQATRESVRQIENIVSTSLMTRDEEKFGVVAVELQGRNRDDIMAEVLLTFIRNQKIADIQLSDLLLRVVPANIKSDEKKLVDEINSSTKQTLILVSEGAKIKIPGLTKKITRKVRSLTVGHPSQSNNMTTEKDVCEYNNWIDTVCKYIIETLDHSYGIVKRGDTIWEVPIDYYAENNPKENQVPEIDAFSTYWLKRYMAK